MPLRILNKGLDNMNKIVTKGKSTKGFICKDIYGHFSEHLGRCIYGGIWVGKDSPIPNINGMRLDVINALKEMKIPVLRWPGGCFADEYHWMDGIGPYENRPSMINTHWGGTIENNNFGTHEFLELCDLIGAEPYINGNVGSGTVKEMQQWMEYMTFDGKSPMTKLRGENGREKPWRVKFFGVGNESWGCGGNMRPEYYADEYRRYGTYVRNFGENKVYKIACGASSDDYNWTEVLMKQAGRYMDGLSLHHYTVPGPNWEEKGSSTDFNEKEWFETFKKALRMDELIINHGEIMDKYDPEKRVGLIIDEWGTWYDVERGTNPGFLYQQNTLRDALVAGITLNIFNNHCDRVKMANIAQLVNVLQAVILTEGKEMLLTPTYHVFNMYKVHQGGHLLKLEFEGLDYISGEEKIPQISVSASINEAGRTFITICNLHPDKDEELEISLAEGSYKSVKGTILTGDKMNSMNSFEAGNEVIPKEYDKLSLNGSLITFTIPSKSILLIEVL